VDDRDWRVCGKGMIVELQHNRQRPGRLYRRMHHDEALCNVCARRHMHGVVMGELHGLWLYAYQNRISAECSHCHRPVAQHHTARAIRQKVSIIRGRSRRAAGLSGTERRTSGLSQRTIVERGYLLAGEEMGGGRGASIDSEPE
jgi:hypothetical protein